MIVVDTLRADRLGCYGNQWNLTPFVDRLAARGMRFERAYSATSWTVPSVVSLLDSRYPAQHGVTRIGRLPAADDVTLPRILAARGYRTAAFSANVPLTEVLRHTGFGTCRSYPRGNEKVRADAIIRKSLLWLDDLASHGAREPLFLYYQFMEPHAPYGAKRRPARAVPRLLPPLPAPALLGFPPGFFQTNTIADVRALASKVTENQLRALLDDYDDEVAALDVALQRLFAELEKRGVLEDALVVITADHGEEFLEHGLLFHGNGLYNEVIRVPLIVLAGTSKPGVSRDSVSLLDLAPTVLDLLKLPPEPRFEGRSLVPLFAGPGPDEPVIAELPENVFGDPALHSVAIMNASVKLLVRPDATGGTPSEVYDLMADPGERAAPTPRLWASSVELLVKLQSHKARIASAQAATREQPIDDRTRQQLRALGYVE